MRRLWAESLIEFDPDIILSATKALISDSEYLPTINKMRQHCRRQLFKSVGLPDVRSAYLEACNAPSPKAGYQWTHAVVYQAGKDTGWQFLASEVEAKALPIFSNHYNRWCDKVVANELIPDPKTPELPEKPISRLSKQQQLAKMAELKKSLGM